MSQIKIERARALSKIGHYPGSFTAMLDACPREVIAASSSRVLASVLDGLWTACQHSKEIAAVEAIDEGGLWDTRQQAFRPLA